MSQQLSFPLHKKLEIEKGFIKMYLIFPFALQIFLIMWLSNYTNPTIGFIFNILCTFLFTIVYIFVFKRSMLMFVHLFILIITQNIAIGLGNTFTDDQTSGANLKLLLINKEVFAISLVMALFLKYFSQIKLYKFENLIPVTVVLFLLGFVTSDASIDAKAYYMRTILIVFISYAIGRLMYYGFHSKKYEMRRILYFVSYSGCLIALIGFLFMLIPNDSYFWNDVLHMGLITEARTGDYQAFPEWDTPLGPYVFPRMFSIIFDAINLGYIIATSLICYFLLNKENRLPFVIPFLFISLLFTFVKGAIALVFISLFWTLFVSKFKVPALSLILCSIAITISVFYILPYTGFNSSHDVHFAGFIEPILNLPNNLFGAGLGHGGNYYSMNVGIPAWYLSSMGTESVIGVLTYQMGILGLVPYSIFFIGLVYFLLKHSYKLNGRERQIYALLSGIVFATFLAAMLQESALGINYTGILTAIVGFYISRVRESN